MAQAEIAAMIGVSGTRVGQLAADPASAFPLPVARLKVGRVWLAEDVENWMRANRKPADQEATS